MNSFFGSLSHSHHHYHAHTAPDSDTGAENSRQPRSFNRQGHAYTIRGRGNKRVSSATVPSTDNQQQGPTPTTSENNPYKNYQYREADASATSTSSPPVASTIVPDGPPSDGGCVPSRLCPSTYNTTAPLYGISLTSGQPVTIVQKFPDLLQQVVFQVCKYVTLYTRYKRHKKYCVVLLCKLNCLFFVITVVFLGKQRYIFERIFITSLIYMFKTVFFYCFGTELLNAT